MIREITEKDYISEIKALAQEGLQYDPLYQIFGANHHRWQFGKPVDMQKIYDFENDMKISLPEALVRYLTELGDGGAGPYYGIYSLDEMREKNKLLPETVNLPVMLDHSMTAEQWSDFAQKYETKEEEDAMQELEDMELSLLTGGLVINTPGCTMDSILMCRGAAAGEVFVIDFDCMDQLRAEPYCCGKFEDWMIEEMKKSLATIDKTDHKGLNLCQGLIRCFKKS